MYAIKHKLTRKTRMRVSKHIAQASDAYIFCNEGIRSCVVPLTLKDSKGRKVGLKENIKKILNYLAVLNNFILSLSLSLSLLYNRITNFLIACYMSVRCSDHGEVSTKGFFICLLSFFLLSFVLSLILLSYDHVGDNGFRCVYVLALRSQYGCLIPFLL